MKKMFLVLVLIGGIFLLGRNIFGTSLAYSYDIDNSVLFYKDDYEELEEDIKIYLSNIDDLIIPNSSFLYSDKLMDNYDFLVHFALDYVINNREYYNNSIRQYNGCKYVNMIGIDSYTSDYVDLSIVYEIIDNYFGVKDFSIINEDVCVVGDYVSLSDYTENKFEFNINDVEVSGDGINIDAVVTYSSGDRYLYSFYNDNNVLKLKNVEVV